jgi:succinate-acetate transporter protein
MADPMPIAFALFAFALAVYFIRFQDVNAGTLAAGSITEALNYALLVAGIAEVLGGVLGMIRGIGYPAYVTTTFGIWLIGFYLLVTSGAANKEFTPDALAWYSLILIVPVAILAVPAFAQRNILFMIAFLALIGLLLFLGLGYHSLYNQIVAATANKTAPNLGTAVDMLKVSAWCGLAAAIAIWAVFAKEVYQITGLIKSSTD